MRKNGGALPSLMSTQGGRLYTHVEHRCSALVKVQYHLQRAIAPPPCVRPPPQSLLEMNAQFGLVSLDSVGV